MRASLTIGLFLATAVSVPAGAQDALWVSVLGTDTMVVEAARRTGSRIAGTIVNVAAGLIVERYEVDLDAAGRVRALRRWTVPDLASSATPSEEPSLQVEIGDDSIRVTRATPRGPEASAIVSMGGAVPIFNAFFNSPMALMDLALHRAADRGEDAIYLYYIGSPQVAALLLERADSGRVAFPYVMARQYPMLAGTQLRARLDSRGLAQFDARETTFKFVTTRHPWRDPIPLARSFAERGLGAGGFSSASPPARATGRIGTVEVTINYGQPRRRGRRIFPDVVPFGKVWRAGANAATQVTFSEDVLVGGHPLPAGSYSLWIIPDERADTLILNGAVRIWGVMYDERQDRLRVPLRRERPPERVEALTYSIVEEDEAGRIELAWDDRRLSVSVAPASSGTAPLRQP